MHITKYFLTSFAVLTIATAPVAAQAAHSLSPVVAKVKRANASKHAESKFGGDSTILLILAVILIGAGIFVLADNGNDNPTSP
jgi:predicted transporter